jgi:hypothetical protein
MQGHQSKGGSEAAAEHEGEEAEVSPGKRTLTEALTPGLQRKVGGSRDVAGGTSVPGGMGGPLPGLATMQPLFGHHDLASVQYVGGKKGAAVANAAGTEALATGGLVVSGSDSPGVVAHEAAHVVMQRGGMTGGPEAEHRADQVAAGVERGQNVQGMLDQVAAPGAANAPMQSIDPMKKAGAAVNIASLSPRDVLMALDTVKRYGEPGVAGDTTFEKGDTSALEARRSAPGFGAPEIKSLTALLTGGSPAVEAVAKHRNLAVNLPGFQTIYKALAGDKRVVGLNEWVVMNSVYVDQIAHGASPAIQESAANQLLDSLNELRSHQVALARLGPADTIDIREHAIAGTNQTADGSVKSASGQVMKQTEVKTVREPIAYDHLNDVHAQLGAGLGKFANAGTGDYEVQVYASYSTAPATTRPMGPYTRTDTVNPDKHSFDRTSTKAGYDESKLVADDIVSYLNSNHKANPANLVSLILENSTRGVETLTFRHPKANANWTK